MAHLENILHAVGIPFSALTSVIFGLMIVSFPLGAYAIFNSDIGDDIDYSFPLEKFDHNTDNFSLKEFFSVHKSSV